MTLKRVVDRISEYAVLLDAELDPSDYEEFFFDFEETEKLFAND